MVLRFLLMLLMSIHGLLHLIGFVSGFQLAKLNQLNSIPSKPAAIAWLIATLLFTISILQYLFKKEYWWMIASVAILLSQVLIILHWKDARFGTIINLILLIPLTLAFARWKFNANYKKEVTRE